jgi:hypothetical protein
VLLGYKESAVSDARAHFAALLRGIFDTFFSEHRSCLDALAGGAPDVVTVVPSTARRNGSPLERAGVGRVVAHRLAGAWWQPGLLHRAGPRADHMHPCRDAFTVPVAQRIGLCGRRVVLIDDLYVSGARAQSAAAALRRAGACSVTIVVAGRLVRPDRSPGRAPPPGPAPTGGTGWTGTPARCARCVRGASPGPAVRAAGAEPGQALPM